MKTVVIGAGASGLMAAGIAAENSDVIVIEKNSRAGRKLAITGKGRCNITNSADIGDFIQNIPGNGRFLYSALYSFTNIDLLSFFENLGVKVKEERGGRIFPVSDSAKDVVSALVDFCEKRNVKFKYDTVVKQILVSENQVTGVKLGNGEVLSANKIILATGGASYPATGATGDGYKLAEFLGHKVVSPKPSLVGLTVREKWVKDLQGLSLKNVKFYLKNKQGKIIYSDFGEMLFTHFGVSGPIVISGSRCLHKYMDENLNVSGVVGVIDLKPALDTEKLDLRIQRDFEKYINKQLKNALFDLLPERLVNPVIKISGIDGERPVHTITREERGKIVFALKNFKFDVIGLRPIDEAIITAGGIVTDEINPSTMESKIVKNLFFCGEIIDVDAITGGFNLQIAFSTGYLAGKSV